MVDPFEIFLAAPPGLENVLRDEARELGFAKARAVPGGVTFQGGWPDVRHANLHLRTANRVLARIASFRAFHLAQLDKRARKIDWPAFLRPGTAVKVETSTNRRSKIYHAGAASERIAKAAMAALGPALDESAPVRIMARIDDNLVTLSLDTSGTPLHKRGRKGFTGKAPLRETLAAAFLRQCGYRGDEPVLDPMCGSGTFLIEAAEMALGLAPGRARRFAFERMAGFDADLWNAERSQAIPPAAPPGFFGYDRDQGAIQGATRNAEGLPTEFACQPISALTRPEGPPGLVMVNPPYGARIGNKKQLYGLYGALGETLRAEFQGWRVGLVTSEPGLARATGLPFTQESPPIPNGGLKIRLYQTASLGQF